MPSRGYRIALDADGRAIRTIGASEQPFAPRRWLHHLPLGDVMPRAPMIAAADRRFDHRQRQQVTLRMAAAKTMRDVAHRLDRRSLRLT